MEDIRFNSYEKLGNIDPNITSISYFESVVFLGNSYGDIKLINGKRSQILHNHNGEITSLISKKCFKREDDDKVYLLSGTSIGNVYVHLVFLNKISDSRILYKFETGYSVFSICLNPRYRIYNFNRVNKRLKVDFNKEILKNYDYWSNLQNSSISLESFIVSLSNGNIYLIYNDLKSKGVHKNDRNELNNRELESHEEKYVIIYVSSYSPYVNMKMNWYKNYITWMDKNGFYIRKLPNFESILFISNQYFSKHNKSKTKKDGSGTNYKNVNYLTNIIDNGELYASTDESDIFPPGNSVESVLSQPLDRLEGLSSRLDSIEGGSLNSVSNTDSVYTAKNRTFRTTSIGSGSTWYGRLMNASKICSSTSSNYAAHKQRLKSCSISNVVENGDSTIVESLGSSKSTLKHREGEEINKNTEIMYKLKRMRSKLVNYKHTRDVNNYGVMSSFISETILVGYNNVLACVKMIKRSQNEFENYEKLLLNTNNNKEFKGYTKNNITKNRRRNNLVRGYIEYKLVLPQEFNIVHILYNTKSQYDVIAFNSNTGMDESMSTFGAQKGESVCYKFDNDGRVSKYKIGGYRKATAVKKESLVNVVFDMKEGTVYCESIIVEGMSATLTGIIVGTTQETEEKVMTSEENDVVGNIESSSSSISSGLESSNSMKEVNTINNSTVDDLLSSSTSSIESNSTNSSTIRVISGSGTKKKGVYMCVSDVLIHIGTSENYISQLKYSIENYDTETVMEHFQRGIRSLFKANLIGSMDEGSGCTDCITPISYVYGNSQKGEDDITVVNELEEEEGSTGDADSTKSAKYLIEYIGIFTEYVLKMEHYIGFKVLMQILNEYGVISQYLDVVFTEDVRNGIEKMGDCEKLVSDIMETVGDNSVIYNKMIKWKMNEKVMNMLLNRIKEFIMKHMYQLCKVFELDKRGNCELGQNSKNEINNNSGFREEGNSGSSTSMNILTSETYFNLLMLLKGLSKSEKITGYYIYNTLYQFLILTSGFKSGNSLNCSNKVKHITDLQTHEEYNHETSATSLNYYLNQYENLQIELLSLKYYYKLLSENLIGLNTKGTLFYSTNNNEEGYDESNLEDANKSSNIETIKSTTSTDKNCTSTLSKNNSRKDSGYIEKNAVNCNICSVTRKGYKEICNKLLNRVGGSKLRTPKSNDILYFSCKHLVHEKCQIKLINHLQDHGIVTSVRPSTLNSDKLLSTCLKCLTI